MTNTPQAPNPRTPLRSITAALAALVALGLGLVAAPSANAQTLTTLYSFCSQSGCTDGANPRAVLVQGSDGNFYGTTYEGGANDYGTVFKITPGGGLTTLYSFCSQSGCTDGELPWAGLVQGSDGNFYGTAQSGGANGYGTVFKITPSGTLTTLYSFCSQSGCPDGRLPEGGLTQATDGNFYGTSAGGGAHNIGTVFKITPSGALTTLYSFCSQSGCTDGAYPNAGLVQGSDGNFYGTAQSGGANDHGTVFKITPGGALTTLYSFCSQSGCTDGANPYTAVLVQGSDGNFYGTAEGGGAHGTGTVFKITPGGGLTTLYSFCSQSGCTDGAYPVAVLVQGSDGNFYGTAQSGGANDYGTVFKITPGGALNTLYSFCSQSGCTDGELPWAGLVQGSDGNFYGTTYEGGANGNYGTVFKLSVSGGVPIASVSPTSLTFGNQDVGTTSPPQPVTLSNTGTAPLLVSSIVALGDFAETDNCNGSVAAGGSCTINVTFTPTGIGTRNGTLTVTDNTNGVPGSQQTVSLTGTGINPGASLSTSSLLFGNQVINTTSAAKKVTLTSTGTTSLNISSITISDGNAGDFAQTNNCPASMVPGAKCTINVTFTPSTVGAESATLDVNDNAANSPQTVALSGTGVPPVTLLPAWTNFGNVAENDPSAAKNFTLTNNQAVALNISSITTSNPDFAQTNTCGSSLAAKAHCTITVTFTPSILGAETATLSVTDDASNSPQTSSLSGTGIVPATLAPATVNFGNVAQATPSATKNVTLHNYATVPLSISSITTGNRDFTETDTCDGSVPAKSTCTITLTFTPSNIGVETGTLSVADSAVNSPQTTSLTGTGIAQVTVSPTSLTFAAQKVGTTSAAKNVTLTNNLTTSLTFSGVTFSGTNAGDFASPSNTCGGSLAAKSHCTISVTFKPTATGTRTATMDVNDSANNSPQTVSLTGTGK